MDLECCFYASETLLCSAGHIVDIKITKNIPSTVGQRSRETVEVLLTTYYVEVEKC